MVYFYYFSFFYLHKNDHIKEDMLCNSIMCDFKAKLVFSYDAL